MIIVKISGGLGNQLFQYALAKAIEQKRGLEVKLDTSFFNLPAGSITPRKFLLDKFNISLKIAKREDFHKIGVPYPTDKTLKENLRRLIFKLIEFFKTKQNKKIIIDHNLNFNEATLNIPDNRYISGSWTNQKYFINIKNILQKELCPKFTIGSATKKILDNIIKTNSVGIHIRRSDYLKYTHKFVILTEKYYDRAVQLIKEKESEPIFFIFSDDITYVKKNYANIFGDTTVYVSGKNITDYEEFWLLSKCKHNIIANSTFSWWGAWLNNNSNKMIVAPNQYRTDNKDMSGFIPSEWISI